MAEVRLPSPTVAFGADFVRRLERLGVRLRRAAEGREGAGRAFRAGAGLEFLGYRPYRPGEDLRQLDWNLLGRLDRPFVRVTRREASERWAVLLDTSASMGVGRPGKLQWAVETATALVFLALEAGARVRVACSGGPGALELGRKGDLWRWMDVAAGLSAAGARGVEALLEPAPLAGADRVFALGDWIGSAPARLFALLRRGRELSVVQVLAREELDPPEGPVEWVDPESGARAALAVDGAARGRYLRELEAELERWSDSLARHRIAHALWTSASPFEDAVRGLFQA